MSVRVPALALVGLLVLAPGVWGQRNPNPPTWGSVEVNLLVAEPLGEFSDFVDAAFGAEVSGRISLDPAGLVSLRGDLGFMIYGYESKRVCIGGVGCRVEARLETSNNIFFGGLGPELALPMGWGRPYVNAFLGFGYFNTSSSLDDLYGGEDHFTTENFGDGTFSWGAGWGVEIRLARGRVPIGLNLGARYHEHGVMEYLTEGDIVDHPDGSITLFPNRTEANLLSYRLGVTIGIPRGGDDEEKEPGRRRR